VVVGHPLLLYAMAKKITWILVKKREINGGKCSKHKT